MSCSICAHPNVEAVNAALRRGDGVRVVAKSFGLGRSVLGDHRKSCLGLAGRVELQEPEEGVGQPPDASADVRQNVTDSEAETPMERPRTSGDDARAIVVEPPNVLPKGWKEAGSFDERVLYVADLIARGRYVGRPTAKKLAKVWNVSRDAVQNYARAAAVVCKADRGDLEQTREASLGAWARIRDGAIAAKDRRAAAAAQAGYDRAAGIVEPGGAKVMVNVLQAPGVLDLLREVRGFLQGRAPELLPELDAHLRGVMASRRLPPGRAA